MFQQMLGPNQRWPTNLLDDFQRRPLTFPCQIHGYFNGRNNIGFNELIIGDRLPLAAVLVIDKYNIATDRVAYYYSVFDSNGVYTFVMS